MKVRLLKDCKEGKAGEIVKVSPERFAFLLSIDAAETVKGTEERVKTPAETAGKPAEKAEEKRPARPAKRK